MKAVLLEVLNMSVAASIAALAVILVRLLLKKAPKVFSYALWAIVLFKLLCPFKLESAFSVLPSGANTVPQSIIYPQAPTTPVYSIPVTNTANTVTTPPVADPVDAALNIAAWVWLTGIVILLGYAIFSYLRLKLCLRAAVLVRDNIWETDRIAAPFVLGFIKPGIYLPLGLVETDYILAHEQTHIRRRDYLIKPLAFFALCLHWFNPVIWLSYFLFCKDMEMSCDESVLKRLGGDIRVSYSGSLFALSVKQSGLLSPLAFGESNTKSRIRNVLKYKEASMWMIIAAVVAVLAVTVGFAATRGDKGITADEAVEQLAGSVTYADGQIRFQIPPQFYSPGDWNIHISGRAEAEDGMSMSVHEFEDVNDAHAWEAGKVYTIPVEGRNLTELTMDIFLPGDNGGTAEGSVDLLAGVPVEVRESVGIIADDINVPDVVLAAAVNIIKGDYEGYRDIGIAARKEYGAEFDNWRLDYLEHEYSYGDMNIEVYRFEWRIHTTTPDIVRTTLVGGMDLSDDGWLLDTYPNSWRLLFENRNGELVYLLAMMENDCSPGDDLFTSDMLNKLEANDNTPFSSEEVAAAKAVVEKYFKAWADKDVDAWWAAWGMEKPENAAPFGEWTITLKDIRYNPQDNMRGSYVTNGRGSVNNTAIENVIVFKCDFNVHYPDGIATGSFNEGDYLDWSVILIRQNAEAEWYIDDQGY